MALTTAGPSTKSYLIRLYWSRDPEIGWLWMVTFLKVFCTFFPLDCRNKAESPNIAESHFKKMVLNFPLMIQLAEMV